MGHGTQARAISRNRGTENVFSCTGTANKPRIIGSGSCTNTCACLVGSKHITQLSNYTWVDSLNGREGLQYNGSISDRRTDNNYTVHIAPGERLRCYRCFGNHLVKHCDVKRGRRGNRRVPRPVLKKQSGVEFSCRDSGVGGTLNAISSSRSLQSDINNVNEVIFAGKSDTHVARKIKCRNRSVNKTQQLLNEFDVIKNDNIALKHDNEHKQEQIESLKLMLTQTDNKVSLLEDQLKQAQVRILKISTYEDELAELNTKVTKLQTEITMHLRASGSSVNKPKPVANDRDLRESNDRTTIFDDLPEESKHEKQVKKAKRTVAKIDAKGHIDQASFKIKDTTGNVLAATASTTDSRGKAYNNTKGDYCAGETRCDCHGGSITSQDISRRKKQVRNDSTKDVGLQLDNYARPKHSNMTGYERMDTTSTPSMEDEHTFAKNIREYDSSDHDKSDEKLVRTHEIRRRRRQINELDSHNNSPHSPRHGELGKGNYKSDAVVSQKTAKQAEKYNIHNDNRVTEHTGEAVAIQQLLGSSINTENTKERHASILEFMKLMSNLFKG